MKWKIGFLIVGAYLVDLLFDLVPFGDQKLSFFPFFHGYDGWDGRMTLQNYVYGYCQHISLIMILYAISLATGRVFWERLMWLELVDVLCYALNYNYTWFTIFGYDVEYNAFKTLAVFYLAITEYGHTDA